MTTDWRERGHTLGLSLGAFHALVVCGMEADATAVVAIAIARAQATRRQVAIGDLFGDALPLRSLIDDDDIHGIVDSFVYGISLSRIARPVAGSDTLFVLPTGSDLPIYEDLLPLPRWGRLTAGFREAGSLFVLVLPADAPRLTDVVAQMDGAVIVGDRVPAQLPLAQVVTILRGEASAPGSAVADSDDSTLAQEAPPPTPALHRQRPSGQGRRVIPEATRDRVALSLAGAAGIGAIVAIALIAVWLAVAPLPHRWQQGPPSHAAPGVVAPAIDSAAGIASDSANDADGGPDALVPFNPGDSAAAAAYAIEIGTANTEAGAMLKLQAGGPSLPAATLSPELIQGSPWYKVTSGAFTVRTSADSLLRQLRSTRVLDSTSGVVVRAPFGFLIDSGVAGTAIPQLLAELSQRGLPVYALRQDNGTGWVLIGAFETPGQASLYEGSLRAAGLVPLLVYRKGRMF